MSNYKTQSGSYEQYDSQDLYTFDIRNGQVLSVFEYENNRLKQEQIDFNESYVLRGQDVFKIEQERGGQEITRYSDLNGDGFFNKVEEFWQSLNAGPSSSTSTSTSTSSNSSSNFGSNTNTATSFTAVATKAPAQPSKLQVIGDSTPEVFRLYKAAFDRTPDHDGLKYWVERAHAGLELDDMASAFIASPEFQAKYGAHLNTNQFLNTLYLNVLDREADSSGLQWWQNTMDSNPAFNRSRVLVEFSESAENKLAVAANLEAFMQQDVSLVGVAGGTY